MAPAPDREAQPLIVGVHHHGVTVSDLDRAIRFYHDVLGLELVSEPSPVFGGPALGPATGVPAASLRQVCLAAGDDIVELIEWATPPAPDGAPFPLHALGAQHLALRVSDLNSIVESLTAAGTRFFSGPNAVDDGVLAGWRWVYFADPDGISVELVEIAYERPLEERQLGIAAYLQARASSAPDNAQGTTTNE